MRLLEGDVCAEVTALVTVVTALANLRYDRHPSGRVLVSALWEELGTGDRPSVAWPEVRRHK